MRIVQIIFIVLIILMQVDFIPRLVVSFYDNCGVYISLVHHFFALYLQLQSPRYGESLISHELSNFDFFSDEFRKIYAIFPRYWVSDQ